jgi:hypothetical protein
MIKTKGLEVRSHDKETAQRSLRDASEVVREEDQKESISGKRTASWGVPSNPTCVFLLQVATYFTAYGANLEDLSEEVR